MFFKGTCCGDRPKLVALVMVVGIGAEVKVVPDAVVGEFHLGSGGQISGEQCQDAVGAIF